MEFVNISTKIHKKAYIKENHKVSRKSSQSTDYDGDIVAILYKNQQFFCGFSSLYKLLS